MTGRDHVLLHGSKGIYEHLLLNLLSEYLHLVKRLNIVAIEINLIYHMSRLLSSYNSMNVVIAG